MLDPGGIEEGFAKSSFRPVAIVPIGSCGEDEFCAAVVWVVSVELVVELVVEVTVEVVVGDRVVVVPTGWGLKSDVQAPRKIAVRAVAMR